ncbi:MAG: tripartite tricarboxylate transporter permease, partial [Spirochaetales bacterium]|nr:tripartite tricarboxylate transporter permease [Spirochaetales bacterium]
GAFGFAELMTVMKHPEYEVVKTKIDRVIPRLREIKRYWKTIVRSGVVGTFIGAVPGVGEDIAAWVSYDMAKRSSKDGDKFGTGVVEVLIAAEAGNNACVAGAMIPVLSLAIPGSAPAAVLLAAMFIHGIRPGPLIMIESPSVVYSVVAMVMIASTAMLVLGLALVRPLTKVLMVPRQKLMPIVFVLCVVGAYAITGRIFDLGVMVAFGLIGYYMREMEYPVAPLVLGIILGDILDKNLRRALIISDGSILPFFTRPISLALFIITLLTILSKVGWFKRWVASMRDSVVSVFSKG